MKIVALVLALLAITLGQANVISQGPLFTDEELELHFVRFKVSAFVYQKLVPGTMFHFSFSKSILLTFMLE